MTSTPAGQQTDRGGRFPGFSSRSGVAGRVPDGALQRPQDPRLIDERLRRVAQEEQYALGLAHGLREG